MMISAFAKAYQVLGDPEHLQTAQRAADFVQHHLYQKRLLRSYREGPSSIFAFAEDYAFLIQGLLDLYEADFDARWLRWAGELQVQMGALFADPKGGYFNTEEGAPDILFRLRDDHDGDELAATGLDLRSNRVPRHRQPHHDQLRCGPGKKSGRSPTNVGGTQRVARGAGSSGSCDSEQVKRTANPSYRRALFTGQNRALGRPR
jgi:hypothetical protein